MEEELLLVSRETGRPLAASRQLLHQHERATALGSSVPAPSLAAEMQQEMVEVVSTPHSSFESLLTDIRQGRALAERFANDVGARAVAIASCPVLVQPHPNQKPRYQVMMDRYGVTARNSLACGQHVHVSIESPEEGVAILDRIRAWLPLLIALSANSPYCNDEDTGYSSYRSVAWRQWASAGPTDAFGSLASYRWYEQQLLNTGALLDAGMLYFDARLSRNYPTVEVRVSDVCLEASTAATLAAITRGLVETAAAEWRAGIPAPVVPTAAIRLASWTASRSGLGGDLVDPTTGSPKPAATVVESLLRHIHASLEDAGDDGAVRAGVASLLEYGTGAEWQRRAFAEKAEFAEVMLLAADLTHQVASN